jgi:hypothetical protein
MLNMTRRLIPAVTLLILAAPVAAQELWPGPQASRFRLDIAKPSFDSDGTGFFTLSVLPSVRFPVGPVRLTADLPLVFYSPEDGEGDQQIGNPWIGVEFGKAGGPLTFQAGARLPLANGDDESEALYVGILGDWDHVEAYLPEVFSFTGSAIYQRHTEKGLVLGARLGTTMISYKEDYWGSDADADLMASYGLRIGYDRNRMMLAATLTGRLILTSEDDEDSDIHQLGFEAGYRFGKVMPMVGLRLPLNGDLKEEVNNVLTVGIKITP